MKVEKCFHQIWQKYKGDPKVYESLKKIGMRFPLPSPHYDYADLIEHIKYSLFKLCTCSPEELTHDLTEIYNRIHRLRKFWLEEIKGGLTSEEYEHYREHITKLISHWKEDFETYLKNICGKLKEVL